MQNTDSATETKRQGEGEHLTPMRHENANGLGARRNYVQRDLHSQALYRATGARHSYELLSRLSANRAD